MKKLRKQLLLLAALLVLTLTGCEAQDLLSTERADSGSEVTAAYTMTESQITDQAPTAVSVLDVPEFSGEPYVVLNGNEPDFTDEEKTTESYEQYSDLDSLGRCGVAEANIGQDLMPTEKRGAIGQVKPTGWHTVKYDQVEGKYLYNRCHLIGYQLTAENANEKNLITGTRYLNVQGMLPFENLTADYVKETGNHVMYRVTPIFEGDNLVASGVLMEAESVEDEGDGVLFCVYVYNVQPGVTIDYATGKSELAEDGNTGSSSSGSTAGSGKTTGSSNVGNNSLGASGSSGKSNTSASGTESGTYILNTKTMKFHRTDCDSVKNIKSENREEYTGEREKLINEGYEACKSCKP